MNKRLAGVQPEISAHVLTNFLPGVPTGQQVDSTREEPSLDTTEEKAPSQKSFVALRLRQGNNNATPDPDNSGKVN